MPKRKLRVVKVTGGEEMRREEMREGGGGREGEERGVIKQWK